MECIEEIKRIGYPRPTIECKLCNGDLILCYGGIKGFYLRHKKLNKCLKNLGGESYEHFIAKNILTQYLNFNINDLNKIILNKKCGDCENIKFPVEIIKFKTEVSNEDKTCRYDIGGLDENNNLIFGIEIYHSHRATNFNIRSEIPWVELKAQEIINKLNINFFTLIDFEDILCNEVNSCDGNGKCIKYSLDLGYVKYKCQHNCKLEICNNCQNEYTKYLGCLHCNKYRKCYDCKKINIEKNDIRISCYECMEIRKNYKKCEKCKKYKINDKKNNLCYECSLIKCIICLNIYSQYSICKHCEKYRRCVSCSYFNILKSEPFYKNLCNECYRNIKSENYNNYTMNEIAIKLGYLIENKKYTSEARAILKLAISGEIILHENIWSLNTLQNKIPVGLWKQFTTREQCLKCECYWETNKYKPYCSDCYEEFIYNSNEIINQNKFTITEEEKKNLRYQIRFLWAIKYVDDETCYLCDKSYKTHPYYEENTSDIKTWWMNSKTNNYISICTICLEKKMISKNINYLGQLY